MALDPQSRFEIFDDPAAAKVDTSRFEELATPEPDQSEYARFASRRAYETVGIAMQQQGGNKADALSFFDKGGSLSKYTRPNTSKVKATEDQNIVWSNKDNALVRKVGDKTIPLVKRVNVPNTAGRSLEFKDQYELTPEGWAEYALSTASPQTKAEYQARFSSEYRGLKLLQQREEIAKAVVEGLKTQLGRDPSDGEKLNAVDTALKRAGLPALSGAGMLPVSGINSQEPGYGNYFADLGRDVGGGVVVGSDRLIRALPNLALAAGSFVSDLGGGNRGVNPNTNWFSRRLAESELAGQTVAQTYAPSRRAEEGGLASVHGLARLGAEQAPNLAVLVLTGGASAPASIAASAPRLAAALPEISALVLSGSQMADEGRQEIMRIALEKGMTRQQAESVALQGATIIGTVGSVLENLPLGEFVKKNPEAKKALTIAILRGFATEGTTEAAQEAITVLTEYGYDLKAPEQADLERILKAGLAGGLVGGVTGGLHRGHENVNDQSPAELTQEQQDALPSPQERVVSEDTSFFDQEDQTDQTPEDTWTPDQQDQFEVYDPEKDLADRDVPEGFQLPIDERATDTEAQTRQLQQQITESDRVLEQVRPTIENAPEPLRGQLPNNAYDQTELPDQEVHPLVIRANAKVATEVSPEHQEVFDAVGKATGKKIIPVTGTDFTGFASPDHPDAVLVDASNPKKSIWNVVAHEIAHTLQFDAPNFFKTLHDRLPQWFRKEAETTYKAMLKKNGYTDEQINSYWKRAGTDEIISMAFGESTYASKMLQRQLSGRDTGLWNAIRSAVEKVLNKFTGRGRLINEISQAMRDAVGLKEKGVARVRDEAKAYSESKGLPYSPVGNKPLVEERSRKVAEFYDKAQHEPNNPEVKRAYDAFKQESLDQFKFLQDRGVTFEPWQKEGQPYENSSDMMKDVEQNKHLWIFTGGDLPADHPLAGQSGVEINGQELTYNDVFRAVHDYFGHSREGFQFGPRGEDNAYRAHSQMYSEVARPAMAAETRGQNSFVNFGPNGEFNRANPKETKYAEQKATVLPKDFLMPGRKSYVDIGHQFRGDGSEELWWFNDGELSVIKAGGLNERTSTHIGAGMDASGAPYRGRIDHKKKEISVAATPEAEESSFFKRQLQGIAEKLQSKYPGYEVYVGLTHGGLTPIQEITDGYMLPKLQNIRHEKETEGVGAKIVKVLNAATPGNGVKFKVTLADRAAVRLHDTKAALSKAISVAQARKFGDNPAVLSPEAFIRNIAGVTEARGEHVKHGFRDLDNKVLVDPKSGKALSLPSLLDSLEAGSKAAGTTVEDFSKFALDLGVAESTVERYALKQKQAFMQTLKAGGNVAAAMDKVDQGPLTGIGGNAKADLQEAGQFLSQAVNEKGYAEAQEFLRQYRLIENEHLRMAVEAGLISKKKAKAILANHKRHVNLQRVFLDEGLLSDTDLPRNGVFRKFRGSNREIDNPLVNMLQSTEAVYKKAMVNKAKLDAIKLLRQYPDIVQKGGKDGVAGTVGVYENGQLKHYTMDRDVAYGLNEMSEHLAPFLGGVLSLPGQLKRWGTSIDPVFRLRNFIRDTGERWMTSDVTGKGLGGLVETLKGMDEAARQELTAAGGSVNRSRDFGASVEDYHKLVRDEIAKLDGKPNTLVMMPGRAMKSLWKGWQTIGEWGENVNRVAEFKAQYAAARKRGMADTDAQRYAAWKSRDLLDFAVSGSIMKHWNRFMYAPFINARLQGLVRQYKFIKKNPLLGTVNLIAKGVLPGLLPYMWAASQGEKERDEYLDTPLIHRLMFFKLNVGGMNVYIPKPPLAAIASLPWEASLEASKGKKGTTRKITESALKTMLPVDTPTALLPFQGMLEVSANYSWYFDRDIVPPYEEGVALDLRNTDRASGIGRWLSTAAKEAGWEVDPRNIDHVLGSELGSIGATGQAVSSLADTKSPLPLSTRGALATRFARLPVASTATSVQDALKQADYYRDDSSPQAKAIIDALSRASKQSEVAKRNELAEEARQAADMALAFYDKHGDELLAAKTKVDKANRVKKEYDQLKTGAERSIFLRETAGARDALRQSQNADRLMGRVLELRRLLVKPGISDSSKAMADREISRILKLLAQ